MKLCFICFGVCVCACTGVIDVTPENETTFTNYFKSTKDAEALLRQLQSALRSTILSQANEPHTHAAVVVDSSKYGAVGSAKNMEINTYTKVAWKSYYTVINAADLILDNLYRFPLSKEVLEPYRLQACFAKGVMYFMLAQRWGEVPITRGTTYFGTIAKSSVTEVLDEAEKWASEAMKLPEFDKLVDDEGDSRKTKQFGSKGAAAALLAHLYAWRAAIENKAEYWEVAENYCTLIIENKVGTYRLAETPEEVCVDVLYRDHPESIWEIYRTTTESFGLKAYFAENYIEFPTKLNARSRPDKQPDLAINKTTVREMYKDGDKRRDAYFLWVDADSVFVFSRDGKFVADSERPTKNYDMDKGIKGYSNSKIKFAFFNKFRHPFMELNKYTNAWQYKGMDMNRVVWRLADIYLLRAECRERQGKAGAESDLNEIRRRAYGDDNHKYVAAEGDLRLAIFREREKELLFETDRYYDVRRNGVEYIRREISPAKTGLISPFSQLTDQDIEEGALYYGVPNSSFKNNDLMRQNIYWNKYLQ